MNPSGVIFVTATLLCAAGMWLLLPRPDVRGRWLGIALGAVGLGLLGSQVSPIADWLVQSVFLVVATITIVAAVATVTLRNPVYCAIWFGLTLLGTAGLFLLQGAQFLAVATVVVYAGAILVMFLFVLMLAQPEGRAPYDRVSWEGMLSAFAGTLIVGMLSMTTTTVLTSEDARAVAATIEPAERQAGILAEEHVAAFAAELLGRHLIAVEVAGTLLLVALIGAAVIVGQTRATGGAARQSSMTKSQ